MELLLDTTSGTFDLNTTLTSLNMIFNEFNSSSNLQLLSPWQVVAESCDEGKRVDRMADILLSVPDKDMVSHDSHHTPTNPS